MDQLTHITAIIGLSMGAAWASGINLYAAILTLGLLATNGYIELPPDLSILSEPLVLMAAGVMYLVEFFADKVPGVDSGWDGLHTFIRIPAAAALAAGAVGEISPVVMLAAALVGGTLAAGTHVTKAGSRLLVNTSPEPFSNWFVSLSEDLLVVAGLWTALTHPVVFLVLLIAFVLVMIWLLPKLVRVVGKIFTSLAGLFSPARRASASEGADSFRAEEPFQVTDKSPKRLLK